MPRDHLPHDTGIRPEDLAEGRPQPFRAPWGEFALYPTGPKDDPAAQVHAAECFCPHMLGPLFQGTVQGDEVTCPWHLWSYSVQTGACTASPKDEGKGTRIAVLPVQLGPSGTYLAGPPGGSLE